MPRLADSLSGIDDWDRADPLALTLSPKSMLFIFLLVVKSASGAQVYGSADAHLDLWDRRHMSAERR